MTFEYKVVPAPVRGLKAKGVKTVEDRFAHALETAMNELASGGWEYLRADTLPCEQREGIMGKTTVFQNMLVFRREQPAMAIAAKSEPTLAIPSPKPEEERPVEPTVAKPAPKVEEEPTQIADEEPAQKAV